MPAVFPGLGAGRRGGVLMLAVVIVALTVLMVIATSALVSALLIGPFLRAAH